MRQEHKSALATTTEENKTKKSEANPPINRFVVEWMERLLLKR